MNTESMEATAEIRRMSLYASVSICPGGGLLFMRGLVGLCYCLVRVFVNVRRVYCVVTKTQNALLETNPWLRPKVTANPTLTH